MLNYIHLYTFENQFFIFQESTVKSSVDVSSTTVWMHHLNSNEMSGKKMRTTQGCCFEQTLEEAPYKTAAVLPLNFSSHKPSIINSVCCLEDLQRVMTDRDGWWEKKSKESVLSTHDDDVIENHYLLPSFKQASQLQIFIPSTQEYTGYGSKVPHTMSIWYIF